MGKQLSSSDRVSLCSGEQSLAVSWLSHMVLFVCSSSLTNRYLTLSSARYLKPAWHVFYLGSQWVQVGELTQAQFTLPLPEAELKHLLFATYSILIRATVIPKYLKTDRSWELTKQNRCWPQNNDMVILVFTR